MAVLLQKLLLSAKDAIAFCLIRMVVCRRSIDLAVLVIGFAYWGCFLISPESFGAVPIRDDLMSATGFGVILLVSALGIRIQNAIFDEITELYSVGAMRADGVEHEELFHDFNVHDMVITIAIFAVLFASVTIGVYYADRSLETARLNLVMGSALAAWLVAGRFSRGVALAVVPFWSSKQTLVNLVPGHRDGAAGFGRLGRLYFEQALFLLVPAAFVLYWWGGSVLAISYIGAEDRFEAPLGLGYEWFDPYIACPDGNEIVSDCPDTAIYIWKELQPFLLTVNLAIFILASLYPAYKIHRAMLAARRRDIEPLLKSLREKLRQERQLLPRDTDDIVHQKLVSCAHSYSDNANCPVWPLSFATLSLTFLANVSSVAGVVALVL